MICSRPRLSDLIKHGKVRADSAVDLVRSGISMAVRPVSKPGSSTVDALKRALLAKNRSLFR